MEKSKKTIKVVAGVIFKDKKIYCLKKGQNKYKYLSNKFEFPGGKIEVNETKKKALKREIYEELGVNVEIMKKLVDIKYEYPDFLLMMTCFVCKIENGNIKLSEHEEVVLKSINELKDLDWLPADLLIIDYLIKNY